jgi:tetratricopeptide (TPR) repeat protein
MRGVVFGLGLVLWAAMPAAAQEPPPAQTPQQRFDAAEAAYARKDFAGATVEFRSILADLTAGRMKLGPRTEAAIVARLAQALDRNKQTDEAVRVLQDAVAPAGRLVKALKGSELAEMRSLLASYLVLNWRRDEALAVQEAAFAALQADPSADNAAKQSAQLELAESLAVAQSARAIPLLQELIDQGLFKEDKLRRAYLIGLKGRAQLNARDLAGASRTLDDAMEVAGSETSRKVTLIDRVLRGDAAIVDWLRGREDRYERLMMNSGVGGSVSSDILQPETASTPGCGAGLTQDDVVILELSIAANGSVRAAQPVYSSKPGQIEAEFIADVRGWSFNKVADGVSGFWRSGYRVALRCSKSVDVDVAPIERPKAHQAWIDAAASKLPLATRAKLEHALRPETTELDRRRLMRELLEVAPRYVDKPVERVVLANLASQPGYALERCTDSKQFADYVSKELSEASIRPWVRAYLSVTSDCNKASSFAQWPLRTTGESAFLVQMLAAAEADNADPDVLDLMRYQLAGLYEKQKRFNQSRDIYERIAKSAEGRDVQPGIAIRSYLRLAGMASASGDFTTAQAWFKRTGLSEDQCALLDQKAPLRRRGAATWEDVGRNYFSNGWVRTEFDILPDGQPTNVRVVASYPPFLYEKGMLHVAQTSRYQPVFPTGEARGCKAQTWQSGLRLAGAP